MNKHHYVLFKKAMHKTQTLTLKKNKVNFEQVKGLKCIGLIIDTNLNWKTYFKHREICITSSINGCIH